MVQPATVDKVEPVARTSIVAVAPGVAWPNTTLPPRFFPPFDARHRDTNSLRDLRQASPFRSEPRGNVTAEFQLRRSAFRSQLLLCVHQPLLVHSPRSGQ